MDDKSQEIIDSVENKENIIFHGPGGCGKSYSIKLIASFFQKKGKKVCCTATTGVAAINLCDSEKKITATTLHSWAGVGTAKLSAQKLLSKVLHSKARERWEETDLLIIDEVSMLGAEFMDKLDYIGQNIKHCDKPFGGIQVLLSGDFLQLPPVKDDWVFNSHVWNRLNLHPFIFEEPKRYDDVEYFNLLLRIRSGTQTPDDEKKLRARIKAYTKFLEIVRSNKDNVNIVKPTFIYSKKKDVNQENENELEKLEGDSTEFIADDNFTPYNKKARYEYYIELLDDSIPKAISLKKGAQVMLKFNMDTKGGLVNGTRGVVLNIDSENERVTVRFINGKKMIIEKIPWEVEDKDGIAVRQQIPLILAWACTVHKCIKGDTTIFTDKGMFEIKDIITKEGWNDKKISVYTRKGIEETSKTFMGQEEDSIKITTRMGYILEGSVRHPILVRTREGKHIWKKMPDLEIGDVAIIKSNLQCGPPVHLSTEDFVLKKENCILTIPEYITDDLCYVMGLLVGDGCYSSKKFGIEFGKKDEQIMETYRKLIKNLFDYDCKIYSSSERVSRLSIFSKNIRLFFEWCGLDFVTAPNKKIPWSVLNNTISAQKSFVRGLFDTDGGVNNGIHLTSVSFTLVKQMHVLLLNLGIISKLSIMREAIGNWSTTYRIHMTGEGAVNYAKYIGFNCERKNKLLDKFRVFSNFVPKSNIGFFPDSKLVAKQIQTSYSLSKKNGVSSLISSCVNGRSTLSTRHIPYLNERLDLSSTEVGRMLLKIHNKGYFFDPITTIEENKCVMYDFEVPGSHSFITNGIVSHNCQSTTLDYAVCDLGANIFCEGQAYVALSRVRNLHGLFITEFYPPSIKVNKKALEYSKSLEELSKKFNVSNEDDIDEKDTEFVIDMTETE